jgi:hypothetical protein
MRVWLPCNLPGLIAVNKCIRSLLIAMDSLSSTFKFSARF